jgi:hypothetical protein
MTTRTILTTLATALLVPTLAAADPRPTLADLPVADMKVVAPAEYRKASSLAAKGAAPVDIALRVVGKFAGSTQHIKQVNEGVEAPSASRVTVLRDGLLDDSVRGDRWEVSLTRTPAGVWKITEVQRAWRCRRGGAVDHFAAALCP